MDEFVCEGCGKPYPSPAARNHCELQHQADDLEARRRGRRH